MTDTAADRRRATLPELSGQMADELARLEAELGEVDLLVEQARMEAGRHETRRVAAVEKLSTATAAAERAGTTLEPERRRRPQQPSWSCSRSVRP